MYGAPVVAVKCERQPDMLYGRVEILSKHIAHTKQMHNKVNAMHK